MCVCVGITDLEGKKRRKKKFFLELASLEKKKKEDKFLIVLRRVRAFVDIISSFLPSKTTIIILYHTLIESRAAYAIQIESCAAHAQ